MGVDISIIITTYNYKEYILDSINSCLEQIGTGLDWEVIVVDDGSTDGTNELLKRCSNPRLKMHRIQNSGIERASNYGFERALGRYFVRVDADDSLESCFLEQVEKHLNDDVAFYYGNYIVVDEFGNEVSRQMLPKFSKDEVLRRGDFLATGTVYRKSIIEKLGYYDVTFKNSGLENYELVLKILLSGERGKRINKPIFKYRRHSKNLSSLRRAQIIENGHLLCKKLGIGKFQTNRYHPYGLVIK